jgi:hypothetical protein
VRRLPSRFCLQLLKTTRELSGSHGGLSFKKGFSTRTLSEFGREPLLPFLRFQLKVGHPLLGASKYIKPRIVACSMSYIQSAIMGLPHRAEYGGGFNLHMLRFFEFVFVVILGMAADVALDFFNCLAHQYQTDGLAVDWSTFPLFAFSISVSIGILGLVLIGQERIIDFKQQRITFILTFVVAALIGGYFFPFPCGPTP